MSDDRIDVNSRLQGKLGPYRLIQRLGAGGNGTVFLAYGYRDESIGKLFAVKVFHGTDAKRRRRFLTEREIGAKLAHKSIVKVVDAGEKGDQLFSVQEYWPETLASAIARGSVSCIGRIAHALQLLSALQHLHDRKSIHRDIKPENIFVRGPDCALGDLGLLKTSDDSRDDDHPLDLEHTIVASHDGEPRMPRCYRTPELVRAMSDAAFEIPLESDIYQLGLVFCELFLGHNPQEEPSKLDGGRFDLSCAIKLRSIPEEPSVLYNQMLESVRQMLHEDPTKRPGCLLLLDKWTGFFERACDMGVQLERRLVVHW